MATGGPRATTNTCKKHSENLLGASLLQYPLPLFMTPRSQDVEQRSHSMDPVTKSHSRIGICNRQKPASLTKFVPPVWSPLCLPLLDRPAALAAVVSTKPFQARYPSIELTSRRLKTASRDCKIRPRQMPGLAPNRLALPQLKASCLLRKVPNNCSPTRSTAR